ncbi:unnamed protein product [Spirodela intermedia]|uniref:Uncharacterized protein n=1 Tax=Spirodela intermedia TaxID=51605 RepID=A0A7I8IMY3_SPIIN|nr:unnamed protein product [Spirodela intermedia]CAA6659206.1 unnamed protein product [Spirodela intermedia]
MARRTSGKKYEKLKVSDFGASATTLADAIVVATMVQDSLDYLDLEFIQS